MSPCLLFILVFVAFSMHRPKPQGFLNSRSHVPKVFRRIRTEPSQYEKPAESYRRIIRAPLPLLQDPTEEV